MDQGVVTVTVRRDWRAGRLGWLLRVHSPGAHTYGKCWCMPQSVGASVQEALEELAADDALADQPE